MANKIKLVCPCCGKEFLRVPFEVKRNEALGRANLCSRRCWAAYVNKTPVKQAQVKAMLAERNANQYGSDNPNWRGGTSESVWGKKPKERPGSEET